MSACDDNFEIAALERKRLKDYGRASQELVKLRWKEAGELNRCGRQRRASNTA